VKSAIVLFIYELVSSGCSGIAQVSDASWL
jgi:hypothetical protein